MQITEVARNTFLLTCTPDTPFSINEVAYLLVEDRISVLIEPGSTTTASRLLSSSEELGINPDNIAYIIPTHIHVDHGGGSGFLSQNLPNARVVLHPRGAVHMKEPSKLINSTRLVFGDDFEKSFGPILAVPEKQIHIAEDGETIRLGKRELKILFSPGHASHHISILDSSTQGIFCGEALGVIPDNMPDFPLPAAVPPFDMQLYLATMDRIAHLRPKLLFYSHCGIRTNAQKLIERAKMNATAFGQIVQKALQAGEDPQKIWLRLSEYVKGYFPEADLPAQYQMILSGYLSYFSNPQSNLRK